MPTKGEAHIWVKSLGFPSPSSNLAKRISDFPKFPRIRVQISQEFGQTSQSPIGNNMFELDFDWSSNLEVLGNNVFGLDFEGSSNQEMLDNNLFGLEFGWSSNHFKVGLNFTSWFELHSKSSPNTLLPSIAGFELHWNCTILNHISIVNRVIKFVLFCPNFALKIQSFSGNVSLAS